MTLLHDRSLIQEVAARARAAVGLLSRAERDEQTATLAVAEAIAAAQIATDAMSALVSELDAAHAEQRDLLLRGGSSTFSATYAKLAAQIALLDARLGTAAHDRMVAEMGSQAANKALADATDAVLRARTASDAADPAAYGLPDAPDDDPDNAEEDDRERDMDLGYGPI